MNTYLYLLPVISAVSGWLIHSATIRYFLKNLLPRQQPVLSAAIGQKVAEMVKTDLDIEKYTNDPRLLESALPAIEHHIDDFLNVKLTQEIPMLAMFVGNKTTDKIKEVFINQIKILFPQMMTQVGNQLLAKADIAQMVTQKLDNLNITASPVLKRYGAKITTLGLLSGFITGLVNLGIIYLILHN